MKSVKRDNETLKHEISCRFITAREALGLSPTGLAADIDVDAQTVRDYENEKSIPGGKALCGLSKLGINTNWLLTGRGTMLIPTEAPQVDDGPIACQALAVNDSGPEKTYTAQAEAQGVNYLLLEEVISVFFGWLDEHADRIRVDRDRYAAIIAVLYRIAASSGKAEKQELEQVLRAAA